MLARVLVTCIEMLTDRGMTVTSCAPTTADVINCIKEGVPVLQCAAGDEKCSVLFHSEERVGVKHMRAWIDTYKHLIIVVSVEGPTPFTRKESECEGIQFFQFKELVTNITKHSLVPKHVRVANPPKNIQKEYLPKIYTSDKVVQYYDFKPGEIIRIERTMGVQNPMMYYRLVV